MLVKSSGKIVENSPINTQASKNNFYGSTEIEEKVTEFDTKYSITLKKAKHQISKNQINHIILREVMESLCFQELRTLSERNINDPLMDFLENFFQPQLDIVDDYESGVPDEINKMINDTFKSVLKSMSDAQSWQTYKMFNVEDELDEIQDLKTVFLKNTSETPFIFSDTPVVRSNLALRDLPYDKHGNMHFGLTLYYPITSELGFFVFDHNAYELISDDQYIITVSDSKDVDSLNILQVHNAVNSIYFSEVNSDGYVKELWESEKSRFIKDTPKVECLDEITLDGYLTGRKVNTLVLPDPTFVPEFSFLKVIDVSDSSSLPYRKRFVKT